MKKLAYTLSFVVLVGLTSKAQDHKKEQADPAKKESNMQQMSTTPSPDAKTHSGEPKNRMAITQKGVPASKAKETKETKSAEPKPQPAATEKH